MTKIAKFYIVGNIEKFDRYPTLEEAEAALEHTDATRNSVHILEVIKGIRPKFEREVLEVAPPEEVTVGELRREVYLDEAPPPRAAGRRNNRDWVNPLRVDLGHAEVLARFENQVGGLYEGPPIPPDDDERNEDNGP